MKTVKELYKLEREKMFKDKIVSNLMATPYIEKVVINMGIGKFTKEAPVVEEAEKVMTLISGKKPVYTKAKKAISNFSLRRGEKVGIVVTLRGKSMWNFTEKLISVVLPRFKDFRGLEKSNIDESGNLHIGIKDHTSFIEIDPNSVKKVFSLQVSMVFKNSNKEKGHRLLSGMGVPFKD